MKKLTFLLALIIITKTFAINDLVVKVPDVYTSKPGFIDNATLVIQPFGAYVEQSLYLEYSDHNQYSAGQKVEIIHRFELPQGSTVNDLWLWIGDSVMKAIVLDTWTGRHIYDSIVSMKRDPAFLVKNGNQYELHIYPLTPGSVRKIKMNFITPAQSIMGEILAELPLKMLNASNNNPQALRILYRMKQDMWGVPGIKEFPSAVFTDVADTLGYHFKECRISNIKTLSTFRFAYNFAMSQSAYFNSDESDSSQHYFQLMFSAKDALGLAIDSTNKKVMFGLDLSGDQDKSGFALQSKLYTLQEKLQLFLTSALKPTDQFNLLVAGCGKVKKISPDWVTADTGKISETLNSFFNSTFFDSIIAFSKKNVLLVDQADQEWGFTGIDLVSNIKYYYSLAEGQPYISSSSIVASYDEGFGLPPSEYELGKIMPSLDSLFMNGGRFLTYFDYNRDPYEQIATHYITGLATLKQVHESVTLYRNIDGNIGADFPETIEHAGTYFLKYNDPDVKIELRNSAGEPTVISKRIGRGIIVVSGLWEFNDDAALKKTINTPLLGLTRTSGYQQLVQLYNSVKSEYQQGVFEKAIIISNGDSLTLLPGASTWADNYIGQYGTEKPGFSSINLLTGNFIIPSSTTYNNNLYYGSGLLMYMVSQKTNGVHFESLYNDIYSICSGLTPYSMPAISPLQFIVKSDNNTQLITDFREIKLEPTIPTNPQLFIGATKGATNVSFDVSAKLLQNDATLTWSATYPLSHDTSNKETIISSMIGNEEIKLLFNTPPIDTSAIVSLAVRYNLLCDFTSMLALEPNDTIHFMTNPFDESILSVNLTSLSASISGKSVVISWSTLRENNNMGFEIERSGDRVSFMKIGYIIGTGRPTELARYTFTDNNVLTAHNFYRLKQINYDGSFVYSPILEIEVGGVASFSLDQNYPNPFNPTTQIKYSLLANCNVKVTIFNSLGERVRELANEVQQSGIHILNFNGAGLSSGVYFYSIEANSLVGNQNFKSTKKMILMK